MVKYFVITKHASFNQIANPTPLGIQSYSLWHLSREREVNVDM